MHLLDESVLLARELLRNIENNIKTPEEILKYSKRVASIQSDLKRNVTYAQVLDIPHNRRSASLLLEELTALKRDIHRIREQKYFREKQQEKQEILSGVEQIAEDLTTRFDTLEQNQKRIDEYIAQNKQEIHAATLPALVVADPKGPVQTTIEETVDPKTGAKTITKTTITPTSQSIESKTHLHIGGDKEASPEKAAETSAEKAKPATDTPVEHLHTTTAGKAHVVNEGRDVEHGHEKKEKFWPTTGKRFAVGLIGGASGVLAAGASGGIILGALGFVLGPKIYNDWIKKNLAGSSGGHDAHH